MHITFHFVMLNNSIENSMDTTHYREFQQNIIIKESEQITIGD